LEDAKAIFEEIGDANFITVRGGWNNSRLEWRSSKNVYSRHHNLADTQGYLTAQHLYRAGVLSTHLLWITFTEYYLCCLRLNLILIEQMMSQVKFIDDDFEERCRRNGKNCSCQAEERTHRQSEEENTHWIQFHRFTQDKRHQDIGFYLVSTC
jgi:hypothetical protein